MVIAKAAKSANFHTLSPSTIDRAGPKNRVIAETRISGTSVPATAWSMATFSPMYARNAVHS